MFPFMWRKVESSSLKAMSWHPLGGGTMAVRFQSGSEYRYTGVPLAVYRGLVAVHKAGESLGSAFHHEIKVAGYDFARVS